MEREKVNSNVLSKERDIYFYLLEGYTRDEIKKIMKCGADIIGKVRKEFEVTWENKKNKEVLISENLKEFGKNNEEISNIIRDVCIYIEGRETTFGNLRMYIKYKLLREEHYRNLKMPVNRMKDLQAVLLGDSSTRVLLNLTRLKNVNYKLAGEEQKKIQNLMVSLKDKIENNINVEIKNAFSSPSVNSFINSYKETKDIESLDKEFRLLVNTMRQKKSEYQGIGGEEFKENIKKIKKEIIDILIREGYPPNKIASFNLYGISWETVVKRMQEIGIDFKPVPKGKGKAWKKDAKIEKMLLEGNSLRAVRDKLKVNSNRILKIRKRLVDEGWIFSLKRGKNYISPYKISKNEESNKKSLVKEDSKKKEFWLNINNLWNKLFG